MNLLALLLGLGVERALTHLFHLRAFHWLDPVFDRALGRLSGAGRGQAAVRLTVLALLLAAPVVVAGIILSGQAAQAAYFVFAVLVLLFSLGPRDLQEEVEEYCLAAEGGELEQAQELAHELIEREAGAEFASASAVRRAIFIQANNRIFGVVFWFLVLGPAGAWLFRVLDLLRQRAIAAPASQEALGAARLVHGLAAWLPGRLMAAGFALSGSFQGAAAAWRAAGSESGGEFFERTETLIAAAGDGASGETGAEEPPGAEPAWQARSAMALVGRTLWLIWYPAVALLTLGNWLQ